MDIGEFCKELPKIELHAHLNGSLSRETLKKYGCVKQQLNDYNLTWSPEKSLEDCFALFKIAHDITSNKQAVYEITKIVIEEFRADNVIYLELRTTPRSNSEMTKVEYVESVIRAIKETHCDVINVKLLLCIDRAQDSAASLDTLNTIIAMKQKYPDIIKGIDLCGDPNVGTFDESLFLKARENGLRVTLHCGEVKNDDEVMKMLNFKPDRIGHATYLHPNYGGSASVWDLYKQLKIPAECCLTSNIICKTSTSYCGHHVQEWIKESLPFTLNTDDKGVFDTTLSEEYRRTAEGHSLHPQDLWVIACRSVDYCFATFVEKQLLRFRMGHWWLSRYHLYS